MPAGPRPFLLLAVAAAAAAAALGCSASSDVSRALGARCGDHDECDERCLEGARYPDGFCSSICDTDGDCPGGGTCVDIDGGVCLFGCSDTPDCAFLGDRWQCRAEPQGGGGVGADVKVCVGVAR